MHYSPRKKSIQTGFTLIEMLVVAPIVILLIGVMIGFISNLTGQGLQTRTKNAMIYDTQSALDDIETNSARATKFLTTTGTLSDTPKQGSDDASGQAFSNVNGGSANTLIFSSAATTESPYSVNRNVVYLGAGTCNSNNKIYTFTTVYFVRNNSLYKRTIMPSITVCATPYQRASCAKAVMESNPPTYCKTQDEKILDSVSKMSVDYYDGDDSLSAANATGANDIGVTLSTSLKSAGDTLSYSGNVRVKITNENADIGETPKPPSTVGSVDTKTDPGTYNCSWESVGGATGYTVKYSFDGGSTWTSRDTDTNTLSTTVDISAKPNQTIVCQAFAHTSTGDVAYKSTSYNIPLWYDCQLENGWQNYGSVYANAQFTKTAAGTVVVKGLVRLGSTTSGNRICQLPPSFRPNNGQLIFENAGTSGAVSRLDVATDGSIIYRSGGNGYISLTNINFQTGATWNNMTASNGWQAYANGYATPQIAKDAYGRAHLQGLAKSGTTTDPTTMYTIPSGYTTDGYNHYPAIAGSNVSTSMAVNNSSIYVKGNSNSAAFLSLQAIVYPTGSTSWTGASFQNGWQNYNASSFVPGRYTKSPDNIVSLQGLIKGGTTTSGTTMFTLPAGYRPADANICAATGYNNTYMRLDVLPDGRVITRDNVNSTWVSLAGCDFIAEQ